MPVGRPRCKSVHGFTELERLCGVGDVAYRECMRWGLGFQELWVVEASSTSISSQAAITASSPALTKMLPSSVNWSAVTAYCKQAGLSWQYPPKMALGIKKAE